MSNREFDLLIAEAHRLRREAKAQLDMQVGQTLEDAAERLEMLAHRMEREIAAT